MASVPAAPGSQSRQVCGAKSLLPWCVFIIDMGNLTQLSSNYAGLDVSW